MRVLIACEESQVVCKAFRERGHEAYSCDIEPCSGGHPEWHIQDDVLLHLDDGWDLMIAHPPCTYLTVTANKYFLSNPERWQKRLDAVMFVWALMNAPIDRIAIENPVGVISSHIRKPDQHIQPYEFGDPYQKTTGIWLKNLWPLVPTNIVEPIIIRKNGYIDHPWHYGTNSQVRSKTFPGIAEAMAEQWGSCGVYNQALNPTADAAG
jgi:hypothetical protein